MNPLIGRTEELTALNRALEGVAEGRGGCLILSGEAGIGKTRLIEELRSEAGRRDIRMVNGAALADVNEPFLAFSRALEPEVSEPLFEEHEFKSFTKLFAVNRAGMLVAEASPDVEEDMDADIFAGMLSAVQDFVRDSFDSAGAMKGGLGRLEYGDMKIMIEHGQFLFLTAVFKGAEHADMKGVLKRAVKRIEADERLDLESWSGRMDEVEGVQEEVVLLAETRFRVRRDLEGVKLENERLRISTKVLGHLEELSGGGGLLVILEDLHWADESSLFVTSYLARNIPDKRILLVGTMRPAESDLLGSTIDDLAGEGVLTVLKLESLGSESVRGLADQMYPGNGFPGEFIDKLAAQCEGNPFFVNEMLRHMGEAGSISEGNGGFVLAGEDFSLPGSVQDVVQRRLERLDPNEMATAEYASCIGGEFEWAMISSYGHIKDARGAVERLCASGIFEARGRAVAFSHAIYQDFIYTSIGTRWKAAYHKNLGEYYEAEYRRDPDEVLYELARHFSRSNEFAKALDYCIRAGEKAEGAFAPEQAIGFYSDALDQAGRIRTDTRALALDLQERLGDLQVLVGEFDKAISRFGEAGEKHEEARAKARLLRKTADAYEKISEYDRTVEVVDRALGVVPRGSTEHGRLLTIAGLALTRKGENDRAMERFTEAQTVLEKADGAERELGLLHKAVGGVHWSMGRFSESLECFEKALSAMEAAGDELGVSSSLHNIGMVYTITMEAEKGLEYYQRSLEMTERLGDAYGSAYTLYNMGYSHMLMDHWEEARDYFEKSIGMKRRMGDVRGTVDALVGLGQIHQHWGQLDKALEYHTECLEVRERIGNKFMIEVSTSFVGECYLEMGEHGLAREFFDKALSISEETGNENRLASVRLTVAMLHNERDEPDNALALLDMSERYFTDNPSEYHLHEIYLDRAVAHLKKGEVEAAAGSLEKARPLAKNLSMESHVLRVEGMVRAAAGDWEAAVHSFERAEENYETTGAMSTLAMTLLEHGRALKAKGDAAGAKAVLERAVNILNELCLEIRVDEAGKELEGL